MPFFTLLAIFIVFLSLRNIVVGYALCILLRLFVPQFVKVGVGDFSVGIYSLFFWLFTLIIILQGYLKVFLSNSFSKYTLLFIFLTVLVGFVGGDAPVIYTIKNIFYLVRDYILILYGLVIVRTTKDFRTINRLLIPLVYVACIYGLFEYITKENPYSYYISNIYNDGDSMADYFKNDIRGFIDGRIQAFTNHPLIHGQMMELVFAYIWLFFSKNSLNKKILLILLFVNVVLAGSRASLIATLLFIVLSSLRENKKSVFVFCFLLIPLMFIVANKEVVNNVSSTFRNMVFFWEKDSSSDIQGSSVESRTLQLAYMVSDLGNKIAIGHGLGYVNYTMKKDGDHPIMHGYESIVLMKVTEVGLVGLFLFIMWYYYLYQLCSRAIMKSIISRQRQKKVVVKYLFWTYFVSLVLTGDFSSSPLFLFIVLLIYIYPSIIANSSSNTGNGILKCEIVIKK